MFKVGKALPVIGAVATAASLVGTPAQAAGNGGATGGNANAKTSAACQELITNGSFERPRLLRSQAWALFDEDDVQAWRTDDAENKIEVWGDDMGVEPKDGRQFAELNATSSGNSMYQDIRTKPNSKIYWSFWIRARDTSDETDVESTQIHFGRTPMSNGGGVNGIGSTFAYSNSATDVRWKRLSGWYQTGANQTRTRVTLTAEESASTDEGFGNLVDMVSVTDRRC